MKKIFVFLFSLCLCSCANFQPKYALDSNEAYNSVKCEFDSFLNVRSCSMPLLSSRQGMVDSAFFLTKATVTINGKETTKYYLMSSFVSRDWLFLNSVFDSDGKKLYIADIDRKVKTYNISELLDVELSWDYLQEHTQTGMKLRFYGEGKTQDIIIPAPYIQGFVRYLLKYENSPEFYKQQYLQQKD